MSCSPEESVIPQNSDPNIDNPDAEDDDPIIEDNDDPLSCDVGLFEKDGECVTYADTCEFGYNSIIGDCFGPVLSPDAPVGLYTSQTSLINSANASTITNMDYDLVEKEISFDMKWDSKGFTQPRLSYVITDVLTNRVVTQGPMTFDYASSTIFDQHLSYHFLNNDVEYKIVFSVSSKLSQDRYLTVPFVIFTFGYNSSIEDFSHSVVWFNPTDYNETEITFELELTDPFQYANTVKIVAIDYITGESTNIITTSDVELYRYGGIIHIPEITISGLLPNLKYQFDIYIIGDDLVEVCIFRTPRTYIIG